MSDIKENMVVNPIYTKSTYGEWNETSICLGERVGVSWEDTNALSKVLESFQILKQAGNRSVV